LESVFAWNASNEIERFQSELLLALGSACRFARLIGYDGGMSQQSKSVTDTSDWTIEVVSVEFDHFKGPKYNHPMPGRKWSLSVCDATGTYHLKVFTPDHEYPNMTAAEIEQKAKEFARSMLACGWRPADYTGTNPVAELMKAAEEAVKKRKENSQN
jgi:hypothetical protein